MWNTAGVVGGGGEVWDSMGAMEIGDVGQGLTVSSGLSGGGFQGARV